MDPDDKNTNNDNNEVIDLSDALPDAGTGAELEAEQASSSYDPEAPKMIQWVIKYSGGLVKDEKQANYVLIGFVAVAIVISLFLIFGRNGGQTEIKAPPGQRVIYPENEPPRLEKRF